MGEGTAVISVPGSKSIANRALILACLASGESCISNVPTGDDTQAMLHALGVLGVKIDVVSDGGYRITGPFAPSREVVVDAQLAGTTSRFLLALGALSSVPITVTGEAPLRDRPIGDLVDALRTLGFIVEPETSRAMPLTVCRPHDNTHIGSVVTVPGNVSSQFISALMMIGPLLPNGLTIHIEGELVSRSYVEMTAQVMKSFGVYPDVVEDQITIPADVYTPSDLVVEPDFSSAAFPIAGSLLAGRSVRIPLLGLSHLQGDSQILDIVQSMGASVQSDGDDVVVNPPTDDLIRGISVDMSDCSDLVPAVAVLASCASEVSELTGIGFIRAKESDRLGDLANELEKTGASVQVLKDGLRISPSAHRNIAAIDTHHDHRMAMSMALLGTRIPNLEIHDMEVVSKSWPEYWDAMSPLLSVSPVVSSSRSAQRAVRSARKAIVAFDVDHTLTIRDCVMPFCIRVTGRFKFVGLLLKNFARIARVLISRNRDAAKALLVQQVFSGRTVSDIEKLGEEFAASIAGRWMRTDTCQVLKWHQELGDEVMLVSASLDAYVRPLAQILGIHHVLCTELGTEDGRYTGEMLNGNCRGEEKANRISQLIGSDVMLDYAYGDSSGDKAMLSMARHGIKVGRSDVSLERIRDLPLANSMPDDQKIS
jgi:3-phosphoshikimate 1-carboxyvinyltransferase